MVDNNELSMSYDDFTHRIFNMFTQIKNFKEKKDAANLVNDIHERCLIWFEHSIKHNSNIDHVNIAKSLLIICRNVMTLYQHLFEDYLPFPQIYKFLNNYITASDSGPIIRKEWNQARASETVPSNDYKKRYFGSPDFRTVDESELVHAYVD